MENKYASLNTVQKLDAVSRIARATTKFVKADSLRFTTCDTGMELGWLSEQEGITAIDMATGQVMTLPNWAMQVLVSIDVATLELGVIVNTIVQVPSPYFDNIAKALQSSVLEHLQGIDLMPFTRAPRKAKATK